MIKTDRKFALIYTAIIVLLLCRIISNFSQEYSFWAMAHNMFLPAWLNTLLILLIGFALVIPFVKIRPVSTMNISDIFDNLFYEDTLKFYYRVVFTGIFAILFILFSATTHFLGDGYAVLANIASDTGTFLKWSEKGITIILTTIQSMFGAKSEETALAAFQVVSVFSGILSIWFYFLLTGILAENKTKRILVFASLLFSSTILLFFGYAENYPLLQPALLGFLYFSLLFLKNGRGLLFSFLFLAFGIFIHLQMAVLIPAFILLPFFRSPIKEIYLKYKYLYHTGLLIIIIVGVYLFLHKYNTDLYFENMFLPLFKGKPLQEYYYIFSPGHLFDVLNQYLLLSSSILLFFMASVNKNMVKFKNPVASFLLACSLFLFLFLFAIDPKLGMIRDWDLFALSAIPLTLFLIIIIDESVAIAISRLTPTIIIFLIVSVVPFLYSQLNAQKSLDYMFHLANTEEKGGPICHIILREYHKMQNMTPAVDSIQTEMFRKFPNDAKISAANKALERGDVARVEELLKLIVPDKFNTEYYNLLSAVYMYHNHPDSAVVEMEKAVQLKNYNTLLLNNLAFIYTELDRYDDARDLLLWAYQLDNSNFNIDVSLIHLLIWHKQYDLALEHAQQLLRVNKGKSEGLFFLAKIYALKKMKPEAEKYFDNYKNYKSLDSEYEKKAAEIVDLINEI
ncbi:MAG: hypothetical protein ABIJ45_08715 [Candidatus Zixiibacteriota bacterium]